MFEMPFAKSLFDLFPSFSSMFTLGLHWHSEDRLGENTRVFAPNVASYHCST